MSATTATPAPSATLPAGAELTAYGALLLRVSLGLLFVIHGAFKIFVFTPAGVGTSADSSCFPPSD